MKQILLYLGNTLIGDFNKFSSNRTLSESLKSEEDSATSDEFTFDINWKQFQDMVAKRFDDDPATFLRVGKTQVVYLIDGRVRFAGWLSARPARSGVGAGQTLSLKFFEHFARLSGDLVCDPSNAKSPMRVFTDRPGHLYVQDLINEFMARAASAGEVLNWTFGQVDTLANKSITYKDFQTVSKALCDSMNNTTGTGKFDVVFRTDPEDYTHQIIDILSSRGSDKNIIIKYPGDGVYTLWSTNYETQETNEYASDVLVSGNGQVGDPVSGENTAALGTAANVDFVQEYCYWRTYDSQSNLSSQSAVNSYAAKLLAQRDFAQLTPNITLVGRPINWGDASNEDNGLAIGDTFYFEESNKDGSDQSGQFRIISLDTSWDENGVDTVQPTLLRLNA
jgi:hypothetical protein